jgi:ATP adenylyltransferase
MENLWAPWRMDYILGPKADACILCIGEDASKDQERQVLYRGESCFAIMNRYPYSNGHIMICPYAHLADIYDLTPPVAEEFMRLMREAARILKEIFKADGLNIGMNIGQAAGAGVRDHLHCHLVPRWTGDSNFIAVLADVRTIPQHLEETYRTLLPHFATL